MSRKVGMWQGWNFRAESPTILVPSGKVAWKSSVLSQTTGKGKFKVSKDFFQAPPENFELSKQKVVMKNSEGREKKPH